MQVCTGNGRRSGWSMLAGLRRLAVASVALLWLAGCGGGSGSDAGSGSGGGGGNTGTTMPIITVQPTDQSVTEGGMAAFSLAVTGSDPLSIQWSSSTDGSNFFAIAGATGTSYTTGPVPLSADGTRYRVVISNTAGTVLSSVVRLTVTATGVAPGISVQPANQTVTAPAAATFSVTASGTSLGYEWQLSSNGGASFSPVPGATAASFAVAPTSVAQSGTRYRVRVFNALGSVLSSAAVLTVDPTPGAPVFTTQPAGPSIVAGTTADFTVVVAGTPTPTLQWRLNGTALVNGVQAGGVCAGATVGGATAASLTLASVPLGCSGALISVVASNGVPPDATSNPVTLTVTPQPAAPVITTQPAAASVQAPGTATFTATASGVPSPAVQWQLSSDGGATYANIVGATATSYITPATTVADDGKRYRAVFSNASGTATSNAALLTVTAAPASGLSLLAGNIGGEGNIDGTGTAARFFRPHGVATDLAGNAYVSDGVLIRKVSAAGVVTVFAGQPGQAGSSDGPLATALFRFTGGLAVDANGNVYVVDRQDHTLRKITASGTVVTLAGSAGVSGSADGSGAAARFNAPEGVAVDAAGTLYVADTGNSTIRKVTPAGVVTTLAGLAGGSSELDGTGTAALFSSPSGIVLDVSNNLYVADTTGSTIRKVTAGGVVTTLAGMGFNGGSADGSGIAARFQFPSGLAIDPSGNLYVGDDGNVTIRKVTPAGVVTTLAGFVGVSGSADGSGAAARFGSPVGAAFDVLTATLLVADENNTALRRVTTSGVVSTVAGAAAEAFELDGTGAAARFALPYAVGADASGNVYAVDLLGNTVRKITASGAVTTVAGQSTAGYADGQGTAARFNGPSGLAVGSTGGIYLADGSNRLIRTISTTGAVGTLAGMQNVQGGADGAGVAASFSGPEGIAVSAGGIVYVADTFGAIRKISSPNVVTTLAGVTGTQGSADGSGSAARFNTPTDIAIDAAGNLFVTDTGNHTIRKVTPAGVVSTFAGTAGVAGSADGNGAAARFNHPHGIAIDSAGTLYVTDRDNHTVRRITPAGVVSTVLGQAGEFGVRLGSAGRLYYPQGIAVLAINRIALTSADAVLIADLP